MHRLIRPGLLVSLKTTVTGGVAYAKRTIEQEHADGAALVSAWETTRRIEDKEDHEQAIVARGKARSLVTGACCMSDFGLLCPASREQELTDAIAAARAIADAYNSVARYSRVEVYVITGRVADNDAEAARAIGSEVKGLLDRMQSAVAAMDADAIRESANKARGLAGMLTEDAAGKVSAAIAEVRKVARQIVKNAKAGADSASLTVDSINLAALESARFAVLDMTATDEAENIPIAGRAIEFEAANDAPSDSPVAVAAAPAIEL